MFDRSRQIEPFENKVWLSSPTMHGEELKYMQEAYETNWMSTVGKNINEVERLVSEFVGCKYAVALSSGTASLHLSVRLAGIEAYGNGRNRLNFSVPKRCFTLVWAEKLLK